MWSQSAAGRPHGERRPLMRKPPPPRPKGTAGKRGPKARRCCVSADIGEGQHLYWFVIEKGWITIRRVHGHKRWTLPVWEGVEVCARRAQLREAERRMAAAPARVVVPDLAAQDRP